MHDQCRLTVDMDYVLITQQPASGQRTESPVQHQVAVAAHQVYLRVVPAAVPQDVDHLCGGRGTLVVADPEILEQVAQDIHGARGARRTVEQLPE